MAVKHGIPATRTFKRVYYDKINLGFKRAIREKEYRFVSSPEVRKEFEASEFVFVGFSEIS